MPLAAILTASPARSLAGDEIRATTIQMPSTLPSYRTRYLTGLTIAALRSRVALTAVTPMVPTFAFCMLRMFRSTIAPCFLKQVLEYSSIAQGHGLRPVHLLHFTQLILKFLDRADIVAVDVWHSLEIYLYSDQSTAAGP